MFYYYNQVTGEFGIDFHRLRTLYPAVSLGEDVLEHGDHLAYVTSTPAAHDRITHTAIEVTPVVVEDVLTQQWMIVPAGTLNRNDAARVIDETAEPVMALYTRFLPAYELREKEAQAYKDAGYTGPVPRQVQAFATPAGITAQQATTIILAQAGGVRELLNQLEEQRMRKYEVKNAPADDVARAALSDILAKIAAINAQLE